MVRLFTGAYILLYILYTITLDERLPIQLKLTGCHGLAGCRQPTLTCTRGQGMEQVANIFATREYYSHPQIFVSREFLFLAIFV